MVDSKMKQYQKTRFAVPKYVVCFYWHGDRWQQKETQYETSDIGFNKHLNRVGSITKDLVSKYVNNLYEGVNRYAVTPFKFVCFTNDNLTLQAGIEVRSFPLVTTKGVLPRMFMFSKEAGLFGHQVLALDIDVIITGSLKDIMNYKGVFCVRGSFSKSEGGEGVPDGDIMSFQAGEETENLFWKPFIADVEGAESETQGRERFWVRKVIGDKADIWQKILPGQILSYKKHVKPNSVVPAGGKIVSCHGYPRPHQITDKWITEYWK